MHGNTFGRIFRVTSWGESHGPSLGVVIDGCPAGISLHVEDFRDDMEQRQGGRNRFSTPRKEQDLIQIESGVFEGKTTGTPISLRIQNNNTNSKDYSEFQNVPRPGHADITTHWKHGHRDYRGGGRSSARETAARVAAGVVAKKILSHHKIEIFAYLSRVGKKNISPSFENLRWNNCQESSQIFAKLRECRNGNQLRSLATQETEYLDYVESIQEQNDSVGGEISAFINNLPRGLGEPVFDKLNATLSHALFSLPAAVYVHCGGGEELSSALGSEIRDSISSISNTEIAFNSNKHGGLLGGMSSGEPLWTRVGFHGPTSIPQSIESLNLIDNSSTTINVAGRHDCFPLPRAVPIVEAMLAITIVDAIFLNQNKI